MERVNWVPTSQREKPVWREGIGCLDFLRFTHDVVVEGRSALADANQRVFELENGHDMKCASGEATLEGLLELLDALVDRAKLEKALENAREQHEAACDKAGLVDPWRRGGPWSWWNERNEAMLAGSESAYYDCRCDWLLQ